MIEIVYFKETYAKVGLQLKRLVYQLVVEPERTRIVAMASAEALESHPDYRQRIDADIRVAIGNKFEVIPASRYLQSEAIPVI